MAASEAEDGLFLLTTSTSSPSNSRFRHSPEGEGEEATPESGLCCGGWDWEEELATHL